MPSRTLANMASSRVNNRLPPEICSIRLLIFRPKPVRDMEPMIMPARMQAAATGAMLFTVLSKAFRIFLTVISFRFIMKPTAKVTQML